MTDQADAPGEMSKTAVESPLVDLSGLTLADVAELSGTALGTALQEIMAVAGNPDAVFTGEHQESLVRK